MNDISQVTPLVADAAAALPEPARRLAQFAAGLRFADIPEHVRERAAYHILDAVGIAHVSSQCDFARRTRECQKPGAIYLPLLG